MLRQTPQGALTICWPCCSCRSKCVGQLQWVQRWHLQGHKLKLVRFSFSACKPSCLHAVCTALTCFFFLPRSQFFENLCSVCVFSATPLSVFLTLPSPLIPHSLLKYFLAFLILESMIIVSYRKEKERSNSLDKHKCQPISRGSSRDAQTSPSSVVCRLAFEVSPL